MNAGELETILKSISDGSLNINEAMKKLQDFPYSDLGFARIDHHRELRTGYPEIVYCAGKTADQVRAIFSAMEEHGDNIMGTRAGREMFDYISPFFPDAVYFETARIISIKKKDIVPPLTRVAGIHRLVDKLPEIRSCRVAIVIAGMEGALASVVGGLVNMPVIAVPTSVGYGASFEGLSALLAMLTCCAAGVTVVNIDNGFGAGFAASRINSL
jgi:NCAIR mutase (PurE)-related protein